MLKEAFFLSFLLLLLSARTRDLAAFYCTDVDLDGMCWRRGGGLKERRSAGFGHFHHALFYLIFVPLRKAAKSARECVYFLFRVRAPDLSASFPFFTVPGAAGVAVSRGAAGEFMSLAFSSRSPSSSSSSKSPPSELTTMPSSSSQDRRGEDIISLSLDPSLYLKKKKEKKEGERRRRRRRKGEKKRVLVRLYDIYLIFKSAQEKVGGVLEYFTPRQSNKDGRPLIFIF